MRLLTWTALLAAGCYDPCDARGFVSEATGGVIELVVDGKRYSSCNAHLLDRGDWGQLRALASTEKEPTESWGFVFSFYASPSDGEVRCTTESGPYCEVIWGHGVEGGTSCDYLAWNAQDEAGGRDAPSGTLDLTLELSGDEATGTIEAQAEAESEEDCEASVSLSGSFTALVVEDWVE